jgi:uncharacterized protein
MRVFLDANVLFSAAKTDGAVRGLLRLLREGGHEGWVDHYVIFEAHRNLTIKGSTALTALDALVASCHVSLAQGIGSDMPRKAIDWLPEKDRPVLASAIRSHCDVLVTSDRTHFGKGYGKVFSGVTIHSPHTLAEMLLR